MVVISSNIATLKVYITGPLYRSYPILDRIFGVTGARFESSRILGVCEFATATLCVFNSL